MSDPSKLGGWTDNPSEGAFGLDTFTDEDRALAPRPPANRARDHGRFLLVPVRRGPPLGGRDRGPSGVPTEEALVIVAVVLALLVVGAIVLLAIGETT